MDFSPSGPSKCIDQEQVEDRGEKYSSHNTQLMCGINSQDVILATTLDVLQRGLDKSVGECHNCYIKSQNAKATCY